MRSRWGLHRSRSRKTFLRLRVPEFRNLFSTCGNAKPLNPPGWSIGASGPTSTSSASSTLGLGSCSGGSVSGGAIARVGAGVFFVITVVALFLLILVVKRKKGGEKGRAQVEKFPHQKLVPLPLPEGVWGILRPLAAECYGAPSTTAASTSGSGSGITHIRVDAF